MAISFKFTPVDLSKNNKNKEKPVMCGKDGRTWRFPSVRDAAKLMNVPAPNIIACLKGRLRSAGGYYWKYLED